MSDLLHDPAWHRDAVIYQLHVKAFRDSYGDGFATPVDESPYLMTLDGRDFFWFRLMAPGGPQRLGAAWEVGA